MKIVGLEEHYITTEVVDAWNSLDARWRDPAAAGSTGGDIGRRLLTLGEERLAVMDGAGIDTQVLSLTTPGLWNLDTAAGVSLQTSCNANSPTRCAKTPNACEDSRPWPCKIQPPRRQN